MEKKLNQLMKNETWVLVPKDKIRPDNWPLGDMGL